MKKIILSAIAVMAFGFANAQEGHFKVGLHSGYPVGKSDDYFSLNLGADVLYMWDVNEKFSAGFATGYTIFLGNEYDFYVASQVVRVDGPNAGFIPVAATGQYSFAKKFYVGADLGYAFSVDNTDSGTGGFLYQPKVGYQNTKWEVYVSYKGIENSGNIGTLNVGLNYKL